MKTLSHQETGHVARRDDLDFLKGVLIILVISFHLTYIGDSHPYAKQIVYTFHMPAFLILSGYLMNIRKPWRGFFRTILGYAIPYIVMESGYILMASVLPIREHIDSLTWSVFLEKLLLDPIGPYWYLQTLIVCGIAYFATFRLVPMKPLSQLIVLGIVLYALSSLAHGMAFASALYFVAGVAVRQSGLAFTNIFQGSAVAIIAFVLLAIHPQNLLQEQPGGILMVYLAIACLLFAYSHIGKKPRHLLVFLGKNTMPLFLFSPIFTFVCKPLVPFLQFDPTGVSFLLPSLLICIAGSLCIEWGLKKTGLSQYFYCKKSATPPVPATYDKTNTRNIKS